MPLIAGMLSPSNSLVSSCGRHPAAGTCIRRFVLGRLTRYRDSLLAIRRMRTRLSGLSNHM